MLPLPLRGTDICSQPCGQKACESSQAYIAGNAVMHTRMAIRFTCDANMDFVRGMVCARHLYVGIAFYFVPCRQRLTYCTLTYCNVLKL